MTLSNNPEQPAKKRFTPAKLVTISALAVVLSYGLCASGWGHPGRDGIVEIGLILFLLGAFGLVAGVIWAVLSPIKK